MAQSGAQGSSNAERKRRWREAHPEEVAAENERARARRAAATARDAAERGAAEERARQAIDPGAADLEPDPVLRSVFRQGFAAGEMLAVFRQVVAGDRRGERDLLAYLGRTEPPAAFYARLTSLGLWGAWEEWRESWRLRGRA